MSELDMKYFFPEVLQAVPSDDYKVFAYMNDGTVRRVDVKPLIQPDTVFWPLRDMDVFRSALTVMNDTVAWDLDGHRDPYRCIDIDPETIFNGPEVDDPLSQNE